MAKQPLYVHVKGVLDIVNINRQIRAQVRGARSRAQLMELRLRSAYLFTLSNAPAWQQSFGQRIGAMRRAAKQEYHVTAKLINRRIAALGLGDPVDTVLGPGR